MTNPSTSSPYQFTKWGKRIAWLLNYLGFKLRIRGFNRVGARLTKADGTIVDLGFAYNSRVDKGAAQQASLMSGSTLGGISSPLPAIYIALSTSSLSPAKGDTTLTGETAVTGLARTLGTVQNYVAPSTLDGAASYDIYHQFTLTGASTTIASTGLFDASSSGNLFCEVNLSSGAVMATSDILQITWTVNL